VIEEGYFLVKFSDIGGIRGVIYPQSLCGEYEYREVSLQIGINVITKLW
jgi:hypothetical protein